jgi:hypothetical protein
MTIIIKIALFVLGMYLSVRVVAALYRIIDLWYTIGTAYPKVIRGIVGWVGLSIAIAALLGEHYRQAFAWGFVLFVIFYPVTVFLSKLLVGRSAQSVEIE